MHGAKLCAVPLRTRYGCTVMVVVAVLVPSVAVSVALGGDAALPVIGMLTPESPDAMTTEVGTSSLSGALLVSVIVVSANTGLFNPMNSPVESPTRGLLAL